MKLKGLLFLTLIASNFGFSQEKETKFTKVFQYSLKGEKDIKASPPSVKVYAAKSGELLSDLNYNNLPILFYYDKLGMSPVSFTHNSRLTESYLSNAFGIGLGLGYTPKTKTIDLEKLNTQETIAGITCQNYLIDFKLENHNNKTSDDKAYDNRLKICIDEKSEYNNFPLMTKIIDQFSAHKSSGANLKGLVLKIGDNKSYDKEYLVVDNIKDTDVTVKIDHRKILMGIQKKADSLAKSFDRITEDYAITDSISANADYIDYIPDYVSTYKTESEIEPSLAIDNEYNKAYLKKIPAHCTNLKSKIPVFDDKNLQKHVYNYTGQICDMYLTPIEFDTVDEKTTIDEIRREVLYFLDVREKLNQSDKKKLDKFLKNLD